MEGKNMLIEDKILAAFWSPTRGQHLPMVIEDVVNRARVHQSKAVPALRRLVNRGVLKSKSETGSAHVYEIAEGQE